MTFSKIVLYARFSDSSQAKGTSLERQFGNLRRERAALPSSTPTVEIADEGLSGFHGHHRSHGELGRFEADALEGLEAGTLLMVERLDRLSRQGHEETLDFLRALTRHGVTVKTLDGDLYEAGKPISLIQVITGAVKAETAAEEAKKRQERTASNWAIRREKARANKTALTRLTPPWVIVNPDGTMRLDAEKAALVRRMFELSDEGLGVGTIGRKFDREGIEPWGRFEGRTARVWQRTFIARILRNREVIGEFQPCRDGKPDGEPWADHYPVVVPADLFARVNLARPERRAVSGGRRSSVVTNLFSGLVRCHECGSKLVYSKGRAAGVHTTASGKVYTYKRQNGSLVCPLSPSKCSNRSHLAYLTFEDAVLDSCLHLALDEGAFSQKGEVARLSVTIAERERALELATTKAEALWEAWAEEASDMRKRLAEKAEAEAKSLTENLTALKAQRESARGRATSEEHLRRVAGVRSSLYCDDLEARAKVRLKVAQALRSVISDVVFDGEVSIVRLAHGLVHATIDRRGKLVGERVRVYRKEFQLEGLRAVEGNAEAVEAILSRVDKHRAQRKRKAPEGVPQEPFEKSRCA